MQIEKMLTLGASPRGPDIERIKQSNPWRITYAPE